MGRIMRIYNLWTDRSRQFNRNRHISYIAFAFNAFCWTRNRRLSDNGQEINPYTAMWVGKPNENKSI